VSDPECSSCSSLTTFGTRNYTVAKELKLSHDFLRSIAKAQEITALHSSHTQPVKVAIIDNGVDQILSSLSKNITKGQSFVERYTTTENRESPWWIAADPHGTQMASLVLDANPCCELYIAKAGRFRKDLKLSNVVEVRLPYNTKPPTMC